MKRDDVVVVTWNDAFSSYGWNSPEDYSSVDKMVIVSLGWFIKQTTDTLVIAQSKSARGNYSEFLTVPKPWVIKKLIIPKQRRKRVR